MNIQEHKNKIRSLSVCSLPVMLAVAGWSASTSQASGPGDINTAQTHCESVPVAVSAAVKGERYFDVAAQSGADWLCISPDKEYFWVAQGADSSISIYRFTNDAGNFELVERTNGSEFDDLLTDAGAGGIPDLVLSDDGEYLHQVFVETGTVGVYEIENGSLTLVDVLAA